MSLDVIRFNLTSEDRILGGALVPIVTATIAAINHLPEEQKIEQTKLFEFKISCLVSVLRRNDEKAIQLVMNELVNEAIARHPDLVEAMKKLRQQTKPDIERN